jgi:hypothetical protein
MEREVRRLLIVKNDRSGKRQRIEALRRVIAADSDSEDNLRGVFRGGDDGGKMGVEEPKPEVDKVDGAKAWATRMDKVDHVLCNKEALSRQARAWIKEELCALSTWIESGCHVLLILLHGPDLDLSGEAQRIIDAGACAPRHVEFVKCRATHFQYIQSALQQSSSASYPFDLVMFSGHGKCPNQSGNDFSPMDFCVCLTRYVCLVSRWAQLETR